MNIELCEALMRKSEDTIIKFVKLMFDSLKSDIDKLTKENWELRKSLEFSKGELAQIKEHVKQRDGEVKNWTENTPHISMLADRIRALEDDARKNNIIAEGVSEIKDENNEKLQVAISKLFNEKLEVNPEITECRRIGSKELSSKPRPVIMKLKNDGDRLKCMKSAAKLKGTNVYLNEDVCKTTQEIRRAKLPELIEKRKQGLIAYFSGINICSD